MSGGRDESSEVPRVPGLVLVLVALLVLTAVTTVLAFAPLPPAGHEAVALAVAGGKAGLVAAFFMHLSHEGRLVRLAAAAGALWLAVFFLFVLVDVVARADAP